MSETWEETKARLKKAGIYKETAPEPVVLAAPRYQEFAPKQMPERPMRGKRFNVHKRSLPLGVPPMDKIVFFNVSRKEAELIVAKFLKTKCYEDDARQTKTVIYYDIIPVDATPRERSIYFNAGPITKEEGSDPEPESVPLEIVQTPEWIG